MQIFSAMRRKMSSVRVLSKIPNVMPRRGANNRLMKKLLRFCLLLLVTAGIFVIGTGFSPASAPLYDEYVYLGGQPVGIAVRAGGLIVTGTSPVPTENGEVYPLGGADVARGDIITAIDGESCGSLYAFREKIGDVKGDVTLTVRRGDKVFDLKVTPVKEAASGKKRLGLVLKEDVGGIGTMTFTTEENAYAALGHAISDVETGLKEQLKDGNVYNVVVEGVTKGTNGAAGGLQARINRLGKPVGRNLENTDIGIYGEYFGGRSEKIRVAGKGEARTGRAQIVTTILGDTPKAYDIDIVKSVTQNKRDEKGLVIRVRDEELLEKTGGIVQGMSGSPIVQNGVLVGAVTHVFLSDPTRGYGVHARFMLEKADETAKLFGDTGEKETERRMEAA